MVHARNKGANGEREAAKYLCSLGFEAKREGRNGYSGDDLRCGGVLSSVCIEVKRNEKIDIQRQELHDAWNQVCQHVRDTGDDREPCVLWRRSRQGWNLTYCDDFGVMTTTAGGARIKRVLVKLAERAGPPDLICTRKRSRP